MKSSIRRKTKQLVALGAVIVLASVVIQVGSAADTERKSENDRQRAANAGRYLGALQPGAVVALQPDEPVWWDGIYVQSSLHAYSLASTLTGVRPTSACAPPFDGGCLDYFLEVPAGITVLRVNLDKPEPTDRWTLEISGPTGAVVFSSTPVNTAEGRFLNPMEGQWGVRVIPQKVQASVANLRAHAATSLPLEAPNGLPDLVAVAPWGFRFDSPLYASPLHAGLLPALPAGVLPTSCSVDELVVNGPARRCLRFNFGWGNIGEGLLDLRIGRPIPGTLSAPLTQIVETDGATTQSPAGTATIHVGHAHYHLDSAYVVEAFSVQDGEMTQAVLSAKRGSCTSDYLALEWWSWAQDRKNAASSDCNIHPSLAAEGRLGISRGWADIYDWGLADNYVDLTGRADGEYVLRATVNVEGHLAEADTTNNVAYAHILVHGSSVVTLERGYGSDPWDKNKIVLDDQWPTLTPMPSWLAEND